MNSKKKYFKTKRISVERKKIKEISHRDNRDKEREKNVGGRMKGSLFEDTVTMQLTAVTQLKAYVRLFTLNEGVWGL